MHMSLNNIIAFSTVLEDWGLQEQYKWYSFPRAFDIPWVTTALKTEPLSLWRLHSSPNLWIISWIKNFITSLVCSLRQGKASIHPVKVSTQTCKQENLFAFGIWAKGTTASFIICKYWTNFHLLFDFFTTKIGVLLGLLQGINNPCSFKRSMLGFNPSLTLVFSGYCLLYGNKWGSLSLITTEAAFVLDPLFSHQDLGFVQLMGEKEQAPYSWKQRPGPCSAYPSPEGVRKTLARS